jgi:hypothetical protein
MNPTPLHVDTAERDGLIAALSALDTARASGHAWAIAEAHLGLARWYSAAGALPFSLALLESGLAAVHSLDQRVELLCERITTLALQADDLEQARSGGGRPARDAAREHIVEASGLAARVADPRWEVQVLLHLSDVLNRFGDHEDATQLQARALRRMAGNGGEGPDRDALPGIGRLADT